MENKKIGFKTIFHDLIESIGLKQGILITIKDLIIKPEEVVKYFIETRGNKKMDISKYLSPLKLFMFIFAAIAVISFVTGYDILNGEEGDIWEENDKYFTYEDGSDFLADTEYYVALDDFYKNHENEQFAKLFEIYTDNEIVFSLIIVLVTALFSKLFFFKRKDYNLASHFVIYIYFGSIMIMVTPLMNLAPENIAFWMIGEFISIIYITYFIIRIFKSSLIIGLIKGFFIFLIPRILFWAMFLTPFLIQSIQEDENLLHEKFVIKYPQFKDYLTCKGDCENGFGVFIYANGGIYEGNWKDEIWHGQGTYSALENEYKGDWNGTCKGDCENGFGVYIYPDEGMQRTGDGTEYVGEYKDGKYHGQGTITWVDGEKYVGEWKDDKKNGQGTFTWVDGDKYVGEWKDDLMNGQGTYTFGDGSEWAGDKYVGEYKDGNYHGQGTYTFGDGSEWAGDKYVGEWKDHKKNGQGTYTWVNGDKYVGEYKDGNYHGQGTYTFGDGEKYIGEWKDHKKNGQGTYTWVNGDKYVGEWKDDLMNGQGTYTFADGTKESGLWENDEFLGE